LKKKGYAREKIEQKILYKKEGLAFLRVVVAVAKGKAATRHYKNP